MNATIPSTDFHAYLPLPDDWVAMCGNIQGSTQAIVDQYRQRPLGRTARMPRRPFRTGWRALPAPQTL
jgi:hypothetical protein